MQDKLSNIKSGDEMNEENTEDIDFLWNFLFLGD